MQWHDVALEDEDEDLEAYPPPSTIHAEALYGSLAQDELPLDVGYYAPGFYGGHYMTNEPGQTVYNTSLGGSRHSMLGSSAESSRHQTRTTHSKSSVWSRIYRRIRRGCQRAKKFCYSVCCCQRRPLFLVPKWLIVSYHVTNLTYALFIATLGTLGLAYAIRCGLSWRTVAFVDADHPINVTTNPTTIPSQGHKTTFTRLQLATFSSTLLLSALLLWVAFTAKPKKLAVLMAWAQRSLGRLVLLLFIGLQSFAARGLAPVFALAVPAVLPHFLSWPINQVTGLINSLFIHSGGLNVLALSGYIATFLSLVTIILALPCWYVTRPYLFNYPELSQAIWSYSNPELQTATALVNPTDFPPPPPVSNLLERNGLDPNASHHERTKLLQDSPQNFRPQNGHNGGSKSGYQTFTPMEQAAVLAGQDLGLGSQRSLRSTLTPTPQNQAYEAQNDDPALELSLELPMPHLVESTSLMFTPTPPVNSAPGHSTRDSIQGPKRGREVTRGVEVGHPISSFQIEEILPDEVEEAVTPPVLEEE